MFQPDSALRCQFALARHDGRVRTELLCLPLSPGQSTNGEFAGAHWHLVLESRAKAPGTVAYRLTATVERGSADAVAAGLVWEDPAWSTDNYVLIPGAVYAGNRFPAERRPYPPAIRNIGQKPGTRVLDIGDIPRLSAGPGRSHLDQTSLDASTPGMGLYFPARREAALLLTPQASSHGAYGLEVIENADRTRAEILLLAPGFLHPVPGDDTAEPGIGNTGSAHLHPQNGRPADLVAGQSIILEFEWHRFPCGDVHGLFERLLTHRAALSRTDKPRQDIMPFSAAWELLHAKHNADNWNEQLGLYQIGLPWAPNQFSQFWQNGWCGGGMTTLAMIQHGDALSVGRARRNLDFLLTQGIAQRGLFKAIMSDDGHWRGDGKEGWDEPWSLVRRQGDCLHFVLRQLALLAERGQAVPSRWVEAARRAASALCDIWEREGEFGFQVNTETGLIEVHGSTSGSLIPGALALASRFFPDRRFLAVAQAAAEHFRVHDLAWGVTTGGPGDAVQAPDGESVFGLVESFITLHEATGEDRWLEAARHACAQGASWAISHPYVFPAQSALGGLGMDARGTLLANAQNKCGVPGICTLAGQGILRTFRAAGDVRLLDLISEIAHAIPQFLSREDRPIPTRIGWGNPLPHLPPGWICERVNITPSWPEPLGEQACYSCWCEVAMMLTWNDLPGVYAQPDTGLIRALDHVRAEWADPGHQGLRLINSTKFPARVRLMAETADQARNHRLPANFAAGLPLVSVPAGGTTVFHLSANNPSGDAKGTR